MPLFACVCISYSLCWPVVVLTQVLTASSSCSYQNLQTAGALKMRTAPCLLDRDKKTSRIKHTSINNLDIYTNKNMEQYLTVAGAGPMQWECWGGEAGSDTAGETPCVGALTVTHPGGETRPGEHWVVRTPQIFHTRLLRCTHTHTRLNAHSLLPFTLLPCPPFFFFFCAEN